MPTPSNATEDGERVLRAARVAWLSPGFFLLLAVACAVCWMAWPEDGALYGFIGLVFAIAALAVFWRIREESVIVGDGWIEIRSPFTGTARIRFVEVQEVRTIGGVFSWRRLGVCLGWAACIVLIVSAVWGKEQAFLAGGAAGAGIIGQLSAVRTRHSDMWLVLPRARSVMLRGWVRGAREIGREIERCVAARAASGAGSDTEPA